MKSGIYKLESRIDGRYYIGGTCDFYQRRLSHFTELRKKRHHNWNLQEIFDKYGEDALVFIVLEECEDYKEREKHYLKNLDPKIHLNLSTKASGGDKITGNPNREEIIKRLKKQLAEAPRPEPRYKRDNSNWRGGKTFCKCGNRKANSSNSCEKCRDRTGDKNPFSGKHHSQETKDKLRSKRLGTYNGNQRKTIIIEGKEFESLSDAAKHYNVVIGTIFHRLKSKNYTEYKYK